jgi:hypothetical protein
MREVQLLDLFGRLIKPVLCYSAESEDDSQTIARIPAGDVEYEKAVLEHKVQLLLMVQAVFH